ncbi:MAG: VIT1/CCC1 transporter family protein [Candidatus Rokubacteria bacterium]|nr:VIT1/CCC1 transporter family protein [Candidatus Rokubacteria bacterium]
MTQLASVDASLARRLILDELFDLSLYRALHGVARGRQREVLEELIPVETRHVGFWQDFFGMKLAALGLGRRLKLALLVVVCRVLGAPAIHLVLEAIEVFGVRKYLDVWARYERTPLGPAVRDILEDEFRHEDAVVTGEGERTINPERVRNVFLGLNDGLVEILGAVSGFFGAFGDAVTVLIASATVAVAGGLSMAAGAYVGASSEAELRATEAARRRFLGETPPSAEAVESPLGSALIVGASYLAGTLVPVLPVAFGARTVLPTVIAGGATIVLVSALLAFLSGMDLKRRLVINLVIIAAAVGITYAIGVLTKTLFGVAV